MEYGPTRWSQPMGLYCPLLEWDGLSFVRTLNLALHVISLQAAHSLWSLQA